MNIIDKIKTQLSNFDPNTAISSAMSVIASITVDNVLSFVYLGLAALTFRHNMKIAILKQELEQRKIESEIETIKLDNERKKLENERYSAETNNLKDRSDKSNKSD